MESSKKKSEKGGCSGQQTIIIRFRVSDALHERLKQVAQEEEMCLAALVRKLVLDSLDKFPS
jgi:hypothetical protein